jgi:glycosyltransferase involved in cell wall biosynthesis
MQNNQRFKVALLVNTIVPYRIPVYQKIGLKFEMIILHGGQESNRSTWKGVEEKLHNIKTKKSWGFQLPLHKKSKGGGIYDYKFMHITPGYFFDLLRYSPDAVITIEMGIRSFIALIYGALFRKPVWIWSGVTLHSEQSVGKVRRILRFFFVKWTHHWISYGEAATEYLLSIGVSRENIVQIQNCVDEQAYLQRPAPLLELQPKPVFLCVGQLIYRKGIDKLLEAVERLQSAGYKFSLLLVGEGTEKEAFQELAQNLSLENIIFYPSQPPHLMPQMYQSADYLVFPTLEDIWGLVVNESLWSGLPVLSSIYAGCAREILPEGNLFDALDTDDICRVLRAALDGKISKPDISKLWYNASVSNKIISEIEQVLYLSHHQFIE